MKCYVDDGHIVFDGDTQAPAWEYAFELSRCDTPGKILTWVKHLEIKQWMTPDLLLEFIELALSSNEIELPDC